MVPGPLIHVDLGLLEGRVVALNIFIANRVLFHVDALLQTHQSSRERAIRQVSLAKGDTRRRARTLLEETHSERASPNTFADINELCNYKGHRHLAQKKSEMRLAEHEGCD